MTQAELRAWQAIFRDVTITLVAAFMLLYETIVVSSPNALVIGGGLTLLGIPPFLRLDARRHRNGDDPYEGPGGYFRE